MKKIVVKHNPENEVPIEVMADAIVQISKSMKSINASRVSRKMLVALIHDNTGIYKKQIEVVLNNLDELENTWLKKK